MLRALAIQSWARLIKKVFEINPLQCPVCKAEMRITSFITDYQEVIKILKHIVEETIRPQPLLPKETLELTYGQATVFSTVMAGL